MRSTSLTCFLFGGLMLAGCRGGDSEKPPVHLIHNMDTQEKGRPYRKDDTGLFADGRVMRAPVEGTIALGQLDEDAVTFEGLDEQGQPTLKYPTTVTVNDAVRARGKLRFGIYCAPCHGESGDGKGVIAAKALDGGPRLEVAPPSFFDQRLKDLPVGRLYGAIKNGVNAGNMPSYAAQVPVEDRWAIVTYVRALQKEKDPNLQEEGGVNVVVAKSSSSSADHGKQLYAAKGCIACHSLDGTRLVGPSLKGLFGNTESTSAGDVPVDEAYLKESMLQPMAKVVTGFPPAMPPLPLDEVEVGSLILFIKAQQ
jgi:mono/diheme cytochrome c family protein